MACRGPPAPGGEGLGEVGPEGDRQPTGRVHGALLLDRRAKVLPQLEQPDGHDDTMLRACYVRQGSTGNLVTVNQTLFQIVDMDPLQAVLNVDLPSLVLFDEDGRPAAVAKVPRQT